MHAQPFFLHTHTHHTPVISCYALPLLLLFLLFANRAALAGLTNANQSSPHAGLRGAAALNTSAESNIKKTITSLKKGFFFSLSSLFMLCLIFILN